MKNYINAQQIVKLSIKDKIEIPISYKSAKISWSDSDSETFGYGIYYYSSIEDLFEYLNKDHPDFYTGCILENKRIFLLPSIKIFLSNGDIHKLYYNNVEDAEKAADKITEKTGIWLEDIEY